ncbi:hypothetical protein EBN88_19080 [Streptomyces triticirhizae]|uniref:Uncharacterized protein n=1 Tax=Streptomyces triticirhizae TaxID=2483353 RepID=A0A3M2LJZ8_9ACTN|nr:hypothetical protein EBN88_19080 [Streptomyces triticirhizae]
MWQRPWEQDGLRYVGPSQLVLDCLAGPGRMPAEGETVLGFMARDESAWRESDLSRSEESILL